MIVNEEDETLYLYLQFKIPKIVLGYQQLLCPQNFQLALIGFVLCNYGTGTNTGTSISTHTGTTEIMKLDGS